MIDDFYNLCFYTIVNKYIACVTNIGENMKPTIKTLIFGFILCLGGLIAKKVYANNHGHCRSQKAMQHHRETIKAISKDVDLTDEQKEMWIDFKEDVRQSQQNKKEQYQNGKEERHNFHKNLYAFIVGDTDASELHRKIDNNSLTIDEKIEKKQEKLISILDILETYSGEQREQALDNLDKIQSQNDYNVEEIINIKTEKLDRIFQGVDISDRKWKKLIKFHEKGIEEREIAKQNIISYLEGDLSKDQVISDLSGVAKKGTNHLHEMVDIWNDILEDLSEDDRQQIANNMRLLRKDFKANCSSEFNKEMKK